MLTRTALKLIRSLATRKGRRQSGLFVAEGPKLVGELLTRFRPEALYITHEVASQNPEWLRLVPADAAVYVIAEEEFARASMLQTPQGVLALMHIPQDTGSLAEKAAGGLCLALDGVQDPGNMGTIVRMADWFGVEDVFCSADTVDVWNPKAVQASMGGLARVRVHYLNSLSGALAALPEDVEIYGTSLSGQNIWTTPLGGRGVLVMGNEGRGVSPETDACCRKRLLIPNYPAGRATTESLNVAMATGIVLAEFRRRCS